MDIITELLTYANIKDVGFWIIVLKLVSEFYSSARNKGGLRKILLSFWFGENLPRVVAEDYKKEIEADKRIL